MAEDVTAMMNEIGVDNADVFGYSMCGGVALQIANQHPELVDRLAVASMPYNTEGYYPGLIEMIKTLTPEMFAGSPPEVETELLDARLQIE